MQYKRRIAVAAAVVAAAVALPAAAIADKPVIRDHEFFVEPPSPGDWCGTVNGTWSSSGVATFRQDASGVFHATQSGTTVFTASATGKSLEVSNAGVDMGTGVDNGDGTITFAENISGLAETFKVPNGPILKDADGKPLVGAGTIDRVATFDIATGDLVSIQVAWHGPHPFLEGVDICPPTIAYLTS